MIAILLATLAANTAGTLFAGCEGCGTHRSTDDGANWQWVGAFGNVVHQFIVDVSGRLYVATAFGICRSTNNGTTWVAIVPPYYSYSNITSVAVGTSLGYGYIGLNYSMRREKTHESSGDWSDAHRPPR